MKKVALTLGFAAAQLFAVGAFAQGSSTGAAPASRGAVKAEAAAANQAGALPKSGEVGSVKPAPTGASMSRAEKDAKRADVKAATATANQAGTLPKTGEVGSVQRAPTAGNMSSETRAEVKAETKSANQAGTLPKNGEVGPMAK